MILSFFRNLRAKIIGAKVGNFVSLDRRGNFVDSGLGPSDLNSPLPEVTTADNGKVLKVITGEWKKGTVREVPTGGSEGQVLTKSSSGFGWADVPDEIPTTGVVGYVLTKTQDGFEWAAIPSQSNKYLHNIRVTVKNVGDNTLSEAIFQFFTDSRFNQPILNFENLETALADYVGTAQIPASGSASIFSGGTYTVYPLAKVKTDGGSYKVYYYIDNQGELTEAVGIDLHYTTQYYSITLVDNVTAI